MLSTITSKGQITIPVDIRRATGLDVGMQVEFIVNARKRVELVPRHGDIRALRGVVPAPAQPVSIDDMNAAIATGWSGVEATALVAHEPRATYSVKLPPTPNAAGE
jgi:antitoxin PrlF